MVGPTAIAPSSTPVIRRAMGTAPRRPIRTRNDAPLYRDGAVTAPSVGRVAVAALVGWGRPSLVASDVDGV